MGFYFYLSKLNNDKKQNIEGVIFNYCLRSRSIALAEQLSSQQKKSTIGNSHQKIGEISQDLYLLSWYLSPNTTLEQY